MTEMIPRSVKQTVLKIRKETDIESIKRTLRECLGLTAELIAVAGAAVVRLTELNEPIPHDPVLVSFLYRVGTGQLSPKAVERFWGSPVLMRTVSVIPVELQGKFTEMETVDIVLKDGSICSTPPEYLTSTQTRQLFSPDGTMRSAKEQRLYLEDLAKSVVTAPPRAVVTQVEPANIRVDVDNCCVVVPATATERRLSVQELRNFIREIEKRPQCKRRLTSTAKKRKSA